MADPTSRPFRDLIGKSPSDLTDQETRDFLNTLGDAYGAARNLMRMQGLDLGNPAVARRAASIAENIQRERLLQAVSGGFPESIDQENPLNLRNILASAQKGGSPTGSFMPDLAALLTKLKAGGEGLGGLQSNLGSKFLPSISGGNLDRNAILQILREMGQSVYNPFASSLGQGGRELQLRNYEETTGSGDTGSIIDYLMGKMGRASTGEAPVGSTQRYTGATPGLGGQDVPIYPPTTLGRGNPSVPNDIPIEESLPSYSETPSTYDYRKTMGTGDVLGSKEFPFKSPDVTGTADPSKYGWQQPDDAILQMIMRFLSLFEHGMAPGAGRGSSTGRSSQPSSGGGSSWLNNLLADFGGR